MNKKKKVLILLVFILCGMPLFASHIVGGEIYYTYAGSNKYNVKLILYRDCSDPSNLLLDDSTSIIAYKRFTTDASEFTVYRQKIDTLPISIPSSCTQLPDVCVEKHTYTATITLPASTVGWTLFFSTCCRNSTVSNIDQPSSTGATYLVTIPPTSQLTTGFGNAEFKSFPPIAVCVGRPISFNNSIISHAGDSIVYSLYTPLAEVDSNSSGQFIFNPILWQLPYSQNDMLGGTPLTINPVTGVLSGTPNTNGQFLVGVQAQVYRNGVLVAETRRDFQFNVTDCFDNVGFTFSKSCGSKFVTFTNRTTSHTTFSWNFGDGTALSTLTNPTHTYANFGTYTVTLHTDSIPGCQSTFSQTITLGNDKPKANFTIGPIPNCIAKGDSIRLTNTSTDTIGFPIVSWQWYVNGSPYSFDKNPVYFFDPNDVFFLNNSVSIKLVVKTATGCADSLTKTFTVKGTVPDYSLTHDYQLCQNGSAQNVQVILFYDFFDFLTFQWTPTTGVSGATSATPTISVTHSSTYYVTISKTSNGFTCSALDSIKINFVKPDIYLPKDTTAPCGTNFVKLTPAGDTTGYTMQWSTVPNFSTIVSTKYSIIINKPGAGTSVTYYYRATFNGSCTYTDSVTVNFLTGAPAIQLADNLSFCTRNITVPVTVTPSSGVQWSTTRNFAVILSTANPLVISQPSNVVKYYVRAGSGNCVVTDSVTVTTTDPITGNPARDTSVCGNKALLKALLPGITIQSYKWSYSNTFLPVLATTDTVTVTKPAGTTRTVYLLITAANGCTITDSAIVTFTAQPPLIQLADSLSFCTRNITVPAVIVPSTPVEWSTTRNFAVILSTANPLIISQPTNVVKYFIRSGASNCQTTDSITVSTADPLTGNPLRDTFICGNKVLLTASLPGFIIQSYKWSLNSNLLPVLSTTDTVTVTKPAGSTQTIYLLLTSPNGCTLKDSTVITFNNQAPVITVTHDTVTCSNHVQLTAGVNIPSTIEWSLQRNFIPVLNSSNPLNVVQPTKTAVYYIRATNNGCVSVDSARVTVPDTFPQIQIDDQLSICNDSVRLNPVLTNVTSVQWSLDRDFSTIFSTQPSITIAQATPTVTYYIKAFYLGCFVTDSVTATVNNIFPVITLADSISLCDNAVNVVAVIANTDSTAWYSDRNLTNQIASGTTLNTQQTAQVRTYYIKSDFLGCSATDSITVTNNKINYASADAVVCGGNAANIDLNIQSPESYTVDWKFNDSTFSTTSGNIQLIADSSGTLSFLVANSSCRIADSLQVSLSPNPVIDAIADKDSIQPGEQVQLNTVPATGFTFNWTPANVLSNSTISNPTSSPQNTTTFVVHVSDVNGCSASDSVTVIVFNVECNNPYIPNAFTPNGDHVNDIFYARTKGLKNIKLMVFDRVGNKVFETTDPGTGWDGMYKGQPAQMDSYGYFFTGECQQGQKITLRGNVTLLR